MHYLAFLPALLAVTSAHGVIRSIQGANGVNMPGLSIQDGTPRDCTTNRCGAQADTTIVRQREIRSGKASPLGRTQGGGPVNAADMIAAFMGAGTGISTNTSSAQNGRNANTETNDKRANRGTTGKGQGTTGNVPASENIVSQLAGQGASQGLPTADDNGVISMTFYQVNGDGAGPLNAAIDPTSGGTDAAAFQNAQVTQDIPGTLSLSRNKQTEFPVKVQMPQGMTCSGTVAGQSNVCVVRVANNAVAGPFGGSAVFTQSTAGKKRALEYQEMKRRSFQG